MGMINGRSAEDSEITGAGMVNRFDSTVPGLRGPPGSNGNRPGLRQLGSRSPWATRPRLAVATAETGVNERDPVGVGVGPGH